MTIAQKLVDVLPGRGVTVSIGVANYKGTLQSPDPQALYKQVDIALYAAKHHGRNCVKLYSPELEREYFVAHPPKGK